MVERRIKLAYIKSLSSVARLAGDFVVKNNLENGATGCVIGLSGGVDSTVTAALIKNAYDRHNESSDYRLELVGCVLPSKLNSLEDTNLGIKIAERLGIKHAVYDIEPDVQRRIQGHREIGFYQVNEKFHLGNVISRIRGSVLLDIGSFLRKSVAGTGNKDEDFGIGYFTMFGDGANHLSPIGFLSKRNVRHMARYLGFPDIADKEPSAGLEPGQTDFKDLGYGYDLVELVIEGLEQGFTRDELHSHFQIVPVAENDIRMYKNAFGNQKFGPVGDLVDDVLRRHQGALNKAEIVHSPIPLIKLQYL